MSIKIALAHDHTILRHRLRALLEREPGMEVVGEVEDGRTALELARGESPDVVVLGIGMPDLSGMDATLQIRRVVPGAKVIAVSMHSDRRYVGRLLRAGASGYLLEDCAFDELPRAIRTVVNGSLYVSPGLMGFDE